MSRFALVSSLALVASPAWAQQFESTREPIVFDGTGTVIDAEYSIPIGAGLDLIVAEFWVGVSITLSGNALFRLQVEGESYLHWSNDDSENGLLLHAIEPLAGEGLAAMQTDVSFDVSFEIWDGQQRGQGSNILNFSLFAQDITFNLEGDRFTPFLLPWQSPNYASIVATSTDAAFNVPLTIPINIASVVTLTPGVELIGYPETTAIYGGRDLVTAFDTDIISQGNQPEAEIRMWEQLPEVDLISQFSAFVDATIGYVIDVNFIFTIDILGLFSFPLSLDVWGTTFPIFSDQVDLDFASERYQHPLPMITPAADAINFGTVFVGDAKSFTYSIDNDGNMDLEGTVSITDSEVYTVSPPDFFAQPQGYQGVVVTFDPVEEGEFTGTLVIESNDPYRPYIEVPITGTAKKPATDDPFDTDNNGFVSDGSGSFYSCNCSSSTFTPKGLAPLFLLLPLIAWRRRED
ncbi:MAG: choice-of-anchor D domain-containing protein [Alphaproteobacteria bacterium]|nr:choice-of-anchor D domain-containing protein [Alphaproteobacteria bacterium]